MNNPPVIVIYATLMAIAFMFYSYNKSDQELMQKWDTCVAQQKVEGAPFEEFMKQCMN